MNTIQQLDPAQATGKTKQLFDAIQSQLTFVPNLYRVVGNSPAALEGQLALNAALSKGVLHAGVREQIALAVAEINGCAYCLSAHTLLGSRHGLTSEDLLAARRASSTDEKTDAILKLARAITLQRGHISSGELQSARDAGLTDAEIVEVLHHVALNILTNYINNVANTVIDFPEVKPGELLATA
jgi:uncharacterized peroxidase-related enzyme